MARAGDRPDPLVGRVLAGYRIRAALARGGAGSVYDAEQVSLGRRIALKIPSTVTLGDHDRRRRFFEEAKLLARLRHPNVVHVIDAGEVEGVPYIAMEFVEGRSLADRMEQDPRPISEMEAIAIASGVLRALDAAHELGIVHRDVKPGNVLLTPDGAVQLADFGFAKDFGDPARSTGFISPEQVKGGRIDARTDVYGLGATLYHALSGRPALCEADRAHGFPASPEEPPPLAEVAPRVPPSLAAWGDRAVRRDPAARFGTAAEALEVLGRMARERRLARPSRRPRAVAATALAIAAGAIGLGLRSPPAPPGPGPRPARPAIPDWRTALDAAIRSMPQERRGRFEDVLARYPDVPAACAEALWELGQLDEAQGLGSASSRYRRILEEYPGEEPWAGQAGRRLGELER